MLKPRFEVIGLIGIRLSQIKVTEYHKMYPFGHIGGTYMNTPQVSVLLSNSTFMIVTWNKRPVHLPVGRSGTYPRYGQMGWLRRIPIHQITSNVGFRIPFHLYIHDCDLEEESGAQTKI